MDRATVRAKFGKMQCIKCDGRCLALGIKGVPGERIKIWPIVQLSDLGETVPVSQVNEVLDHGSRAPAAGVMVFVWGTLHPQWNKVEAMREFYRLIRPGA